VTDYLPELGARDARFTRLTVAHLLDMRSGLRWRDHEFITSDKAREYYHAHLRRLILNDVGFTSEPGERRVLPTLARARKAVTQFPNPLTLLVQRRSDIAIQISSQFSAGSHGIVSGSALLTEMSP
jgi:hypothetical protein